MTPKFMAVLEMCLENGIKLGLNRAYKHDDDPPREVMENVILEAIKDEIYEWFEDET